MASALEQTKNLFSVDNYNEDDISDKSKIIKALDNPVFGEFRSKEDIIDKAKKTGTGLLTGTLGIPSDVLSGAEMVNTALADYANHPTAMVLKNAFKEASDKYGRPAFDKWFNKTTGLESNPENVDQLIGEILSPTGTLLSGAKLLKPLGNVGKQIVKDTKAFFDDMSGGDGGALATANNAPIQATDETSKLLDKTKTTKPIDTNIPALPSAGELANKPTINPTIIGTQTDAGKKAEAIYDDLIAKGVTDSKEIFKKTGGGYVGSDGKFRFDLDDRDAVFKKDPDNIKFDIDEPRQLLDKINKEPVGDYRLKTKTILLGNLLKYDQLYKEYFKRINVSGEDYKALKNIKVVLDYADTGDNTLGFYRSADDSIHLNMQNLIDPRLNKQEQTDYTMSTLIHEVQHAVQRREGFYGGSNPDDTKELILKNIDKDGMHTLSLGRGKKEISLPYISGVSRYNTDSAYSAYSEAGILSRAINNNSNTDKFINLADHIADDITNFTGDRKIEFLRNYEILLDSKNRLKGEMERYKTRIKKIAKDLNISEAEAASLREESSSAFSQIATDIFPADFKKTKSAFGFKDLDTFANFVFQDLKSIDDLKGFVNRAYNEARVNINLNDKTLAKIEAEQGRRLKNDEQLLQFKKEVDLEANKLYREEYGEMEARLVQQRYARRQELRRDPMLFTDEQITEKMLDDTGTIFREPDKYGRTTKILGGFNKRNKGGLQLAKGGVTMYNQMEMFQDGGLKDEGGTVDPVSGNDVPSGSTQEEVRDDIPAQLSEGEFVFPADVVRFIGLEKLMQMRQKAKAGLARMEEMGQMGNSEEAIIPDDAPFSIEDLDMEDETEYNQGGVVKAQTGIYVAPGTGVMQPQTPNTRTTGISSYTAPIIPSTNTVPTGGYKPTFFNQADTEGVTPSFQSIIGNKPGQYDEFREYINEAGMKLQIPFKDGQPIYPIPEGYRYVDPEATKAEDVTVETTTPQTTSVLQEQEPDGGGSDPAIDAGLGGARTTIGGVDYAVQYDFTGKVTGIANVKDAINSGRANFQQPTVEVANLISQQNKAQRGMLNPYSIVTGKAQAAKSQAISATNQLNSITDPLGYASIAEEENNIATDTTASQVAEEENNISGSTDIGPSIGSPSISAPNDDVESISADVETDALGNADIGPNSHGFDAYGSGVSDRQGTATGIDDSGAISYSPDHDWGQPTQTTVDDQSFGGPDNTSSGNPASNPSDQGLGSISTDGPDGGPGDDCFTKGTKVRLYEGGTIAIENLKKGDVILSIHGKPNTVLGMDEHNVSKNNRSELIQIEGYKKPFITTSHPFYKNDILMSFNKKKNDQYHPWLGKVENAKNYFKYKKVLAKEGDKLYNLYLDGDHTHYANGLPVHNIVRNGHISFALFYKNYITAKQYKGDVEYVKGIKNRLIRLGYSKIAYPLAYEIMNDTLLGKITAIVATPFVKAMAKSYHQQKKISKVMNTLAYLFVYPTFYLRGLIGR